ncbi:hypothetical protein J2S14_003900 [Lederbergia wuyishanensis]|uniref:Uncharacterized protein n=1 Tax=Lederbergia wuyishanensis TaxID=1347903 RepID=A0ABU0D9G4_9BACI|nr:hypothetical protein [Lederbergia wuyishanensis]
MTVVIPLSYCVVKEQTFCVSEHLLVAPDQAPSAFLCPAAAPID